MNEIPNIQKDFEVLIKENQWLIDLISGINREETSPAQIYKQFINFTIYLPEFERFQLE
jgi:type III secretion system FlhB-like substrate exporter